MCFNIHSWKQIIIGLFIAATISGCSQENQPYFRTAVIDLSSELCSTKFADTIERFVFGDLTRSEVIEFWGCIEEGMRLFRVYVKGKNPGRISKNELRDFLQYYFIKDRTMSDELLLEVMRAKTLFIGGSTTDLRKSELVRAEKLIAEAREITLDLLPHMDTLSLPYKEVEEHSRHRMRTDEAVAVLERSVAKIAKTISKNQKSYKFSDLLQLIKSLDEYFIYEDPAERFKKMQDYIPLIAEFKGLMRDNEGNTINGDEWVPVLSSFAKSYGLLVRYFAEIEDKTVWQGEGLVQLDAVAQTAISLISQALDTHSDNKISHQEMEKLFVAAESIDIMPEELNSQNLQQIWQSLVDRILSEGVKNSNGFERAHLNNFISEYNDWHSTQLSINHALRNQIALNSCDNPFFRAQSHQRGLMEMKRVVDCAPWAVTMDDTNRIYIDYDSPGKELNHYALSSINFQRALVSLLIQAYAKDSHRKKLRIGVTKSELKTLYSELKPVFVALKLVSKDDKSYYKNMFRDTKFMMPQSNGDKIVNMREGIEYFYGAASGVAVGDKIAEHLKKSCHYKEKIGDRFGAPFFDMNCFRYEISKNFGKFYHHLPELVWYQENLSDKKWQKMIDQSLALIDFHKSEMPYISFNRVVEFSAFMQYIESFMLRFDDNQDQYLGFGELLDALPLFLGGIPNKNEVQVLRTTSAPAQQHLAEGLLSLAVGENTVLMNTNNSNYPKPGFLETSRGGMVSLFYTFRHFVD